MKRSIGFWVMSLMSCFWLGWFLSALGVLTLVPSFEKSNLAYFIRQNLKNQQTLLILERQIKCLEKEKNLLLKDREFQEKEVRRHLGYLKPNEKAFDFSNED